MRQALSHRGPDGWGEHIVGPIALAHTRLAIIDPNGGAQPLLRDTHALVGNGEIYNYLELIHTHDLRDLPTGSDFEPVVRLVQTRGTGSFKLLRGMYAFALAEPQGLWLVRDPFGIKPLYTVQTEDVLAFASEPRALIAGGFASDAIDAAAAHALMALNYTPGPQTIWADVQRLPTGEMRKYTNGKTLITQRQPVWPPAAPAPKSRATALSAFDQVMRDSVSVHMRADVPYGLFLSGGVDSSIIATLTAQLSGQPIHSFVCGFEATGAADERARARAVAGALNLQLHEVTFTEDDFWQLLPQVAWAGDDPTTDPACLPTLKLAMAAQDHVKVVLTGEGGDELFGGYGRYRRALRPWWLGGRKASPQGAFRHLPGVLYQAPDMALDIWRAEAASAGVFKDRLLAAQSADIATWLPADLLLKLDRCLMAQGLEGRTPFLDPQVAAFARSLPTGLKVRGRHGKYLLRCWLAEHLPAAQPFSRKQGFSVPLHSWLAPHGARLADLLGADPYVRELAHPDKVRALLHPLRPEHAQAAYNLMFYALWRRVQANGQRPDMQHNLWDYLASR